MWPKLSSARLDNSDKPSPPITLDYPTPPHLISLSSTIFLRSPDPSFVIKSLHNPNSPGYNISINTTNSQNSNSFFLKKKTTGCQNRDTIPLSYSANSFNMDNSHDSAVTDNRSEILTWLSPLEPHLRHNDIRTTRVKDVGDWLLYTEEFRSWRNGGGQGESQKATMFCSGNLGVGKTYIR